MNFFNDIEDGETMKVVVNCKFVKYLFLYFLFTKKNHT